MICHPAVFSATVYFSRATCFFYKKNYNSLLECKEKSVDWSYNFFLLLLSTSIIYLGSRVKKMVHWMTFISYHQPYFLKGEKKYVYFLNIEWGKLSKVLGWEYVRVTIHSLDVLSKYGSVIVEKKSSVVCHVTVSHRMYFFCLFQFSS